MNRTSASAGGGKGLALLLLALTQFVIVLDASIVNVALPSIGRDLHVDEAGLAWVVNAYTLVFGGFLLLGGRLADLLGRRRLFVIGLVLFSLASLAGGLAQSEGWLVAARAVQGLGGALISPAALSLLTTTFAEGAERNRALGVWGAVAGSGGAAGVLLGGVLTDGLGWEWVLFVNVPIGLLAAFAAPRVLAESRAEGLPRRFDVTGALTVTGGLALLVYALLDANSAGWGSAQTIALLAVAVVLLGTFVGVERRSAHALMPFSVFRVRTRTAALAVGLLTGMALFSMFFFVSLYLQQVLHYSPLKAGVAYLPLALLIMVSAGGASQLVTRIGFKPTMVAGLSIVTVALLWFSRISADGSFAADMLGPSALAGIGLGLTFVPIMIAAMTGTEPHEAGLASGLINTMQQVGGALGVAILSAIAASATSGAFADGAQPAAALVDGFRHALLAGAGFALLGAIIATLAISSRASREHAAAARAGAEENVPVAV